MVVVSICFSIWVLLPILVVAIRWSANRRGGTNVTAVLGLLTVNISFFYLPWLDLSPIKGSLWRDLLDFAPDVVGQMLSWRSIDSAARGLETVSQVVGFFELSGWETLLVTVPHALLFFLIGLLGIAAYLLTILLAWPVRHPAIGYALALCAVTLFCITIYFLPEIEELGERSFPSLFAIAVPLLQVEINWLGPLMMLFGLLLMLVGGLAQTQQEWDENDLFSETLDDGPLWESA